MKSQDTERRNKVAMVTGTSTGIGLEISRTLAMHGFNVAMTARSAKKLKHIITDHLFKIKVIKFDKTLNKVDDS